MKGSFKGANPVVRLLLAHGEKIVMVAILACVVMLIMSALKRERLEDRYAPTEISQLADRATSC